MHIKTKATLLISLMVLTLVTLDAQVPFPDLVVSTFGSDQELINGIQFSNHYGRIDGHPYFHDGRFRVGSVFINNKRYEQIVLRYNLYSQKVEIEYWTANGNMNQFMSVAEKMPSFSLEGIEFRRMQFPDETPGYYQVISSGKIVCYIGWKKEIELPQTNSSKKYEFSPPRIKYWLKMDQQITSFHNRRTFMKTFPTNRRKEILKLLKQKKFSFKQPTPYEVEAMIRVVIRLYETENLP